MRLFEKTPHRVAFTAVLTISVFLFFILWLNARTPLVMADEFGYIDNANRIYNLYIKGLGSYPGYTGYPFGYSYFLVFFRLFSKNNVELYQYSLLLNGLFSIGIFYIVGKICRFYKIKNPLPFQLTIVLFPGLFFYNFSATAEVNLALVQFLFLYIVTRIFQKNTRPAKKIIWLLLLGVTSIFAFQIKETGIINSITFIIVAWRFIFTENSSSMLRKVSLAVLVLIAYIFALFGIAHMIRDPLVGEGLIASLPRRWGPDNTLKLSEKVSFKYYSSLAMAQLLSKAFYFYVISGSCLLYVTVNKILSRVTLRSVKKSIKHFYQKDFVFLITLNAFVISIMVSSVYFTFYFLKRPDAFRGDYFVYERYSIPFLMPLILLCIIELFKHNKTWALRKINKYNVPLFIFSALFIAGLINLKLDKINPFNVPTVMPLMFRFSEGRQPVIINIFVTLFASVIILSQLYMKNFLDKLLVISFAFLAINISNGYEYHYVGQISRAKSEKIPNFIVRIEDELPEKKICYDIENSSSWLYYKYRFLLQEFIIEPANSAHLLSECSVLVSPSKFSSEKHVRILKELGFDQYLWISKDLYNRLEISKTFDIKNKP